MHFDFVKSPLHLHPHHQVPPDQHGYFLGNNKHLPRLDRRP